MTKVVAVITAGTPGEAERQARTAIQRGADLVEFRLDRLRDLNSADIRKLAKSFGPRAIATLRSPPEGGGRPRSGLPRLAVLRELCQPGFGYVDLELEADAKDIRDLRVLAKRHRSRVIVSRHFEDFVGASKIRDTLEASAAVGDIAKAVVPIAHWYEALEVVDLARSWAAKSKPYVLIGMGPAGAVTRVLAGDLGQAFHYAAFGAEAAPGQLPLRSAVRVHGPEPFVVGLVGHRIGHSISPQIHEAALDAAGLPGVYLPFDVEASDLEPFAALQLELLRSASRLLTEDGRLVYATCSTEPEENEQVVERFLSESPGFRGVEAAPSLPEPARHLVDADGFFRTSPEENDMDGYFAAILVRR